MVPFGFCLLYSSKPIAHNTSGSLSRVTFTNYFEFEKFLSHLDDILSDKCSAQLEISTKTENRRFKIEQKVELGEKEPNVSMQQRSQLNVAWENFRENPVHMPRVFKGL